MKSFNKYCSFSALTAVASFIFVPLFGAQAIAQKADLQEQTEDEIYLEELIVTAQKRSESVQDIPISIAAFSDKQLNALGITQSGELGQFVPGLEIGNSSGEGSQLILFLRGAGLNDLNTNNAGPVGIYSDEVYVSSPALSPFQLFDAERVEVLKGPQGTIYGRNTTGGAVKFITKKPTRERKYSGRWRIGNQGRTTLEASASGPLSDTVSARVAVIKQDSDGFGTNLADGSDINGIDSGAYRALVQFEPNDRLKVLVNVHGANVNSQATSFSPLGTLDPTTGAVCSDARILANECVDRLGYRAPDNELDGNFNEVDNVDLSSKGGYVQVDYEFGNNTFTSVTAFDELDRTLPEESDGSPNSLLAIDFGVSSDTFSQEFRLTGSSDRIDWLAGAFYLNETLNQNQTIDLFRSLREFTGGARDISGAITGAPIFFARSVNEQRLETAAIYTQFNFQLNDSLALTLGGRYTDETREFDALAQFEEPGTDPLVNFDFRDLETSADAFSYRAALEYKPNYTTLYYGSVSRGFKSGGFNGGFLSVSPEGSRRQLEPFDPEFLTAFELGVKADFLDSRVRVNAALFLNQFSDLQVFSQINTGAIPVLVLDNASDAESKGLEIEASTIITPGLTATLNAAFIRSELKDFIASDTGLDFSGNNIAQTPETSISGILAYETGLRNGGRLNAQASFAYKDDLFFGTENNPLVGQSAYTLVNTRIAYTTPSEIWTISAFMNNVTDERYATNVSDIRDITASFVRTFGLPRTYGLELQVDF